jgi:penicillin-binding protein 1A
MRNSLSEEKIELEKKKSNFYKKLIKRSWQIFLWFFGLFFSYLFILSFFLPSFEQLENPKISIASEIYSADGVLLGKFFIENRTPVTFDSISPHVVNALVSTEDARFYSHSGIDPEAIVRVLVKTILLFNQSSGGGSTISQQLAKLLVGRPNTKEMFFLFRYPVLITVKLKEWLTAVKLERSYTKKEILTIYLNEFDFLYNAHGIRSAAETYFGKKPIDLDINESAMLVRMLKNPSMYNFKRDMERALKGREVVLNNMMKKGFINQKQYDTLRIKPIDATHFKIQDHNEGVATYFREYLREYVKEVLERPNTQKASDGRPFDLYRDGLKIYTTIDSRMQIHLEQAVWEHLSKHQIQMFKHWPDWNSVELKIGYQTQNPWTCKTGNNTQEEIEMRLMTLNRCIWESERYRGVRASFLKKARERSLTDVDIYRLLRIEKANKQPIKDRIYNKEIKGKDLMESWKKLGYINDNQIEKYIRMLSDSDWPLVKQEYERIMKYMQTPVQMKVFGYVTDSKGKVRGGDKDTLLSPFDSIRYHKMFLQAGSIAIDPKNGHVKAWVGGIDYHYFKVDHVSMGSPYVHPTKRNRNTKYKKVGRQVGSSIKPFLYSYAIGMKGLSPCYEVDDIKITIEKGYGKFGLIKDWTPNNANGKYSGQTVTLTRALSLSLNSVSAQLMKDLGTTQPFRGFLNEIGIDTSKVPAQPSICLGTPDLSPIEMTAGYSIFANGGVYYEPIFLTRITTKNGTQIYSDEASQDSDEALDKKVAFAMSKMLQAVQAGAPGFGGIKSPHGGKTGTTNFHSDGWYIGITPNLVIGTWVGNDDRYIRFRSIVLGQGGAMARPIFQNALRYIESDSKIKFDTSLGFPVPEGDLKEMDCSKYGKLEGDTFDATDHDFSEEEDEGNGKKRKKKTEVEVDIDN